MPNHRDNLSGIQSNWLVGIFLFPGRAILWLRYMFPSNYTDARQSARQARSPIVTWIVAFLAWIAIILFAIGSLLDPGTIGNQ